MKPDKNQRSKQTCQDLQWKVHNGALSFVLLLPELCNQNISMLLSMELKTPNMFCVQSW